MHGALNDGRLTNLSAVLVDILLDGRIARTVVRLWGWS